MDEPELPQPPARTTVGGRALGTIGWLGVFAGMVGLGFASRLVAEPPSWSSAGPWLWMPVLFALYATLRDSRFVYPISLVAVVATAASGFANRAQDRPTLGTFELVLAASAAAVTIATFSGRIKPSDRD